MSEIRAVCYLVAVRHLFAALLLSLVAGPACGPGPGEFPEESLSPSSPRDFLLTEGGDTTSVLVDKALYLRGTLPTDPEAPVGEQTRSAMEQLGKALNAAGLDHSHVVSCHVHLSDMEEYSNMNSVYGSFFSEGSYPARTTIEVPGIEGGADVLLMCVAHADSSEISVVRPPEEEIPAAMGPYSPAVVAGSRVYLSGQGGRNPVTGMLADTPEDQAAQTLETIGVILTAAGLGPGHAVHLGAYLPPGTDSATVDEALAAVFEAGGAPGRVNMPLTRLPGDIAVEITVVAAKDDYITRLFMHDQPPSATFSPVSLTGNVAYTSASPGTGDTFQAQFRNALEAQRSALQLAFLDLANVVRVIAYLTDLSDLPEFRSLLAEAFPEKRPAVVAVQARNPTDVGVSLEMIAVK